MMSAQLDMLCEGPASVVTMTVVPLSHHGSCGVDVVMESAHAGDVPTRH